MRPREVPAAAPEFEGARGVTAITEPPAVPCERDCMVAGEENTMTRICKLTGSVAIASALAVWSTSSFALGTAEQRAALNEFADAAIRAARTIKEACPIDVVFTPTARLETMQKRLEGMVEAVAGIGPLLDRFYGLLTDEQKARLDAVNEQYQRDRRSTAGCNAALSATRWAAEQIDKAVQPSPEQQAKLDALKMSMTAAANDLTDACPSSLPTTPPARLKAITRQLNVLLGAVKNVHAALDDLYASLTDEQKSQFNRLGRQRSAKQ